ncbi:acyl-CoA dehydrogenase family protein [Nocardioides sp. LHD-245]|uniref:acyl-CoA dehydrogenase family protein n=1 Tax=Nocardioides sp. LHD-245 TaxID=3051387 RepID=UPI0027E11B94|nr:acyl-CoA dehydrogenase family protein [Nocardioides sp. LHD-245]
MSDQIELDAEMSVDVVAERTRTWLEEHLPQEWKDAAVAGGTELDAVVERLGAAWFEALGGSGLATPSWPREYGGLGLGADAAAVIASELARRRAARPEADFPGLALGGPTIIAWGSEQQKQRFLPPLARGQERWCQLFSEPGAGSDLAALQTRAVRQDDGSWRITGQKVWNSFAHISDFGMLMARTDPAQPKHRGITYFLLDMRSPGVSVRPLRQLNGEAEFNEVFLDDVVVPDSDRLGPEGAGWEVGLTTLMAERSGLSGRPGVGPALVGGLVRRARHTGAWSDPLVQDRLVRAWVQEKVLQMATVQAFVELGFREPGAEGSLRKLAHAGLEEEVGRIAADLEPAGLVAVDPEDVEQTEARRAFLSAKILSIAGGTSEIQRNIIGERLLGLPREPDPYVATPYRDRPRS